MKMSKPRASELNYQAIIESKEFEDAVRVAVKIIDVQKQIDLSMPSQFGIVQVDFIHADNVRWRKAVAPPPFFAGFFGPSASSKLLDVVLWEALKEGKGDADKVWELFKEYLIAFSEGVSTVETGIRVRIGGRKGHESEHGTEEEKRKRWDEYQTFVNLTHSRFPQFNFSMLLIHTANHFSVSTKTIKRHVKNPLR